MTGERRLAQPGLVSDGPAAGNGGVSPAERRWGACPAAPGRVIIPLMSDRVVVHLGDRVRLRKKHACGGFEWEVVRLGVDIGLVCLTCRRRVLLPRSHFNKRLKTIVARGPGSS